MSGTAPGGPISGLDLSLRRLAADYANGKNPASVIEEVLDAISRHDDAALFIDLLPESLLLQRAEALKGRLAAGDTMPLYGVPFAVKDNIDAAGRTTTAGCPDFAYLAESDAAAVARLVAAGAILIGKTNLDQFATGLVGVRSPYGVPRNSFDPALVPGGSSSGSAVAVAAGLVSFALGTDTAGSGRVPAAFNNIVGLKPSRGAISTLGVVPACRTLDCVSVFSQSVADAMDVLAVAEGYEPADPYSRPRPYAPPPAPGPKRLGVPRPDQREFLGDADAARLFDAALAGLAELGHGIVEIDYAPFAEAAKLLYEGPWVAERYAAVGRFMEAHPGAALDVLETIVLGGRKPAAYEAFEAEYRLAALRRAAEDILRHVDALVLPTTPTIYTCAELAAEPIALNSNLGLYTNFMNLLDMAGIAVPAGFREDGSPFGITVAGPAFSEPLLAQVSASFHHAQGLPAGATGRPLAAASPMEGAAVPPAPAGVLIAVFGAHMRGQPLNGMLLDLGARYVRDDSTADSYRMYAIEDGPVPRPGLVRVPQGGGPVALELWHIPEAALGALLTTIAPPLGLGTVFLSDGAPVLGFICEAIGVEAADDITGFGGWRAYQASRAAAARERISENIRA